MGAVSDVREDIRDPSAPDLGATVTTTLHAIGWRSEVVTGTVMDYRRLSVVVQTERHGRIVVPLRDLAPED